MTRYYGADRGRGPARRLPDLGERCAAALFEHLGGNVADEAVEITLSRSASSKGRLIIHVHGDLSRPCELAEGCGGLDRRDRGELGERLDALPGAQGGPLSAISSASVVRPSRR